MTPTSAKIAIHIFAIPSAPRIRQTALIPSAKYIFSYTIRIHFLEILIAFAIFFGSSSIRTTSAASIAASDPSAPMAIPISALDNTGASLIPSPTNASFSFSDFCSRSSSTFATLSAGRSSLYTSPIPNSSATLSATRFISPVSITVLVMPAFFRSLTASFACGFNLSEIRICPAYLPSTAT